MTISMRVSLATIFSEIPTPSQGLDGSPRYQVREVADGSRHFIGRDSQGQPCLLLGSGETTVQAPIRLAVLEVRFSVPCRITASIGAERTETLTTIVCTAREEETRSYFARVAETILHIVGPSPSIHAIASAIRRLVELFQQLSRPASRSVTGLFGELYAIHRSHSPKVAVQAWRSAVDDRFDFSIDDVRLEVKASSERVRAHNFSLEQCNPPNGTVGLLLSFFVESSGGGLSIQDLIERIEHQLDGDANLILRLQETVAATLGDTTLTALAMRFDESLARSSLQAYELKRIPAIREGIPLEVTQVRFRSDISRITPADLDALGEQNSRLRDLLPPKA